jgi:transposase
LLERAAKLFDRSQAPEPVDLAPLHAKIGQQALELDFLNSSLTKAKLLSVNTRLTVSPL